MNFREKDAHLSNESCPVLVGGGTDGASVNVGVHTGMKAQMHTSLGFSGLGVFHTVWN